MAESAPSQQAVDAAAQGGGKGGPPPGAFKIYVGNLNFETTDEELREHFSRFGEIEFAKINTDPDTGKKKWYGFVTFMSKDAGETAIAEMNGTELRGRTIMVAPAAPRQEGGAWGGGKGKGKGKGKDWSQGYGAMGYQAYGAYQPMAYGYQQPVYYMQPQQGYYQAAPQQQYAAAGQYQQAAGQQAYGYVQQQQTGTVQRAAPY